MYKYIQSMNTGHEETAELQRIVANLRLKVSIFNQNFYVSPLTSFSSHKETCALVV